jgi:hypothetical protein
MREVAIESAHADPPTQACVCCAASGAPIWHANALHL